MTLIVLGGLVFAYVLGYRTRAVQAAWLDHRDQRAKLARANKARWVALQAAVWPVGALAVVALVVVVSAR